MDKNILKLHSNQKIFIYEMLTRGISVEVLDVEREIIRTSYKGHTELIYDRDSSIMPYSLSVLAGDKGLTKRLLQEKGISVPIGETFKVTDYNEVLEAFRILDMPVVIKPVKGSHGYDVYANLTCRSDIMYALENIREHRGTNTDILIEEYYPKKEFRVFITKNKDYAVLHRDPAHVYGDGIHSIFDLIEQENYDRMHPRRNALCEILIDKELERYLSIRGKKLSTIPKEGEKVYLRENSNIAMGGVTEDFTDRVDPSVIDIALKTLDCFPGLPYMGLDFMTDDITSKQDDCSYRIIECNTVPGVDMHYRPAIGKSQNISKYMVNLIYPETKGISLKLK